AFAIGVLAPPDSSLVSYDPALATAFEGTVNDSRTAIAIIDGDDVGNGMESRLLLDHLNDAVAYSRQIDTALSEIVDQLNRIPSTTAGLAGWVMFAGHGVVVRGGGTSGRGLGGVVATRPSAGGGFRAGGGG